MDPLLTEMCKRYEQLWRKQLPGLAKQLGKGGFDVAFLATLTDRGLAKLVVEENGQEIWKATQKLVRDVAPELAKLQPSPAPDYEPQG
jgi:hypothetical protein